MDKTKNEIALEKRVEELEALVAKLEKQQLKTEKDTVSVPDQFRPIFDQAQKTVAEYFAQLNIDPSKASIKIADQRYILLRASSLSVDFIKTIQQLYSDKGEEEALQIGQNFLFDIAHVIGMEDARNFHEKMKLTDPIAKLSAGPVHFAYAGWAFVEILPDSAPSPDENFFLHFNHPFSFEADSWIQAGKKSNQPVCIMNSGYASGWCEESYGLELTSVEISCKACGDDSCAFIMAPPHKIQEQMQRLSANKKLSSINYVIPSFFNRKRVEEEIQKAKQHAEASDRAKSEFLANMSHEIRTPLNTILGFTDLLQKLNLTEEMRSFVNNIQYGSEHLLHIVNDVLDLSKITSGQLLIHLAPFSLEALLGHSYNFAKGLHQKQGSKVELSWTIDPDIVLIQLSDVLRLQQVLINLLSNSIKFTKKGTVEWGVKLSESKEDLIFFVRDTGVGIPKDKQDFVFDMFEQVDSSRSRKYGGTGLGLTISKKLVEMLGGTIGLKSVEGKGSYFYFTIPNRPQELMAKSGFLPASRHKITFEKAPLILITDDNKLNQKLASKVLLEAKFEVLLASDGQEAIDLFLNHKKTIDLILMDVQMPILDGLEATTKIRAYEAEHEMSPIPIVALTAHAMKGDMERCMDAGFNAYLTKPFRAEDLLATIRQILYKKNKEK